MRMSDTGGMAFLKGSLSRGLAYRAWRLALQVIGLQESFTTRKKAKRCGQVRMVQQQGKRKEKDVKKRASVLLA